MEDCRFVSCGVRRHEPAVGGVATQYISCGHAVYVPARNSICVRRTKDFACHCCKYVVRGCETNVFPRRNHLGHRGSPA